MASAPEYFSSGFNSADTDTSSLLSDWKHVVLPSIATLREMAGNTEDEFLQIGAQLQEFYQCSMEISSLANRLVDTVSGQAAQSVTARLREMMADMATYLSSERERSRNNYTVLENTFKLLDQVSEPLESFQKMYKVLRMLSTSTKIESARIGEKGSGFVTLAMDVEKLSHLVNDKSGNILAHRQVLLTIIDEDLRIVRSKESAQAADVNAILSSTTTCVGQLEAINGRCTRSGEVISSVSYGISQNIGEVVSSLQAHDMTRQQVEHVIEALERLMSEYAACDGSADADRLRNLVIETGDVCELQAAQLEHAAEELTSAVSTVMKNLHEVSRQQTHMAKETLDGLAGSTGNSFIEEISSGLSTVTGILSNCAEADRDMAITMKRVAETIGQITAFVTDIEDIGSEIDLIALNSQIKAAHTGTEGAALGVLAEAIKRLSVEAVAQTESVSQILLQINESTAHLFQDGEFSNEISANRIPAMEEELAEILRTLGDMNAEVGEQLSLLHAKVHGMTADIQVTTSKVNVHEKASRMAGDVLVSLNRIVAEARKREPASNEFKQNLLHMQERYTMQSERRIHEELARKRSGQTLSAPLPMTEKAETPASDSEFGDNVDLF